MAIKFVCDACGTECTDSYPEHIIWVVRPPAKDQRGYRIRLESLRHLCDACWTQDMRIVSEHLADSSLKPNRYKP